MMPIEPLNKLFVFLKNQLEIEPRGPKQWNNKKKQSFAFSQGKNVDEGKDIVKSEAKRS